MSDPGCTAITGANGFLGSELVRELNHRGGRSVRPIYRRSGLGPGSVVGNIGGETDWSEALKGVDTIIHLAGIGVDPSTPQELAHLRETNVVGTLRLAEAALESGVRRLVYLSTVKVLGERTEPGEPFTNESPPQPGSPYPQSKRDAEIGLLRIAATSSMQVILVRPPMVYGPHPVGNFARLARLVAKGLPLPFARVRNARSIISRANLVDALIHCADHPAAANRALLVSDGMALSTADLVRTIAQGLDRRPRLLPVPPTVMRVAARLLEKEEEARRLLENLELDIEGTARLLGWAPPRPGLDEIRSAARAIQGGAPQPLSQPSEGPSE